MMIDCREDPCGECRYCRFEGEPREAELANPYRVIPPVEPESWCCEAYRAEGWECAASCGRPCCIPPAGTDS